MLVLDTILYALFDTYLILICMLSLIGSLR